MVPFSVCFVYSTFDFESDEYSLFTTKYKVNLLCKYMRGSPTVCSALKYNFFGCNSTYKHAYFSILAH